MPNNKKCNFCENTYKSTKTLANHVRTKHPKTNDPPSTKVNQPPLPTSPAPALPIPPAPPIAPPQFAAPLTREEFVNYKNDISNTINAFTFAAFEQFSEMKEKIANLRNENAACIAQISELTQATANNPAPSKPAEQWQVAEGTRKNVSWGAITEVPLQNRFSPLSSSSENNDDEVVEVPTPTSAQQRRPTAALNTARQTAPTPVVVAAPALQRPNNQRRVNAAPNTTQQRAGTAPNTTQQRADAAPNTNQQRAYATPNTTQQCAGTAPNTTQQRADAAPNTNQQRANAAPNTTQQRAGTAPDITQQRVESRHATTPAVRPNHNSERSTRSVLIVGDSMIKNITSYQIRGKLREHNLHPKINVKPFLGAQTRSMPLYCEALFEEIDKPDIAIVHVGTNDIRAGTPVAEIREHCVNMFNYLQQHGIDMVVSLLTCRTDDCKDKVEPINHMLIDLCDQLAIGYSGNENIRGEHLNQSGYHLHRGGSDILACNLSNTIIQIC